VEVSVYADIAFDTQPKRKLDRLKLREGDIAPLRLAKAKVTQAEEEPIPVYLLGAFRDLPTLGTHGVEESDYDLLLVARGEFGGVESGKGVLDLFSE
jgi:hypothetical protein